MNLINEMFKNEQALKQVIKLANSMWNRNTTRGHKYKGVSCFNGKFHASITVNKHRIDLGTYDNDWESALAYNKADEWFFDEFARLNIVEGIPDWVNISVIRKAFREKYH